MIIEGLLGHGTPSSRSRTSWGSAHLVAASLSTQNFPINVVNIFIRFKLFQKLLSAGILEKRTVLFLNESVVGVQVICGWFSAQCRRLLLFRIYGARLLCSTWRLEFLRNRLGFV